MSPLPVHLTARRAWVTQTAVIASLVLAHVAVRAVFYATGHDHMLGLARLFNVALEQNVPSFYSAFVLLGSAALLLVAGADAQRAGDPDAGRWRLLAAAFAFVSLDEATSVHEGIGEFVQRTLHTSGALYYAWVIPYGLAALAAAGTFVGFLRRLPRPTAVRFVIAGLTFVTGAVGMELAESALRTAEGTVLTELSWVVEETLEMLGAAYFLTALLHHLETRRATIAFAFGVPVARPTLHPAAAPHPRPIGLVQPAYARAAERRTAAVG